jgi:hypothetical protein
MNRSKCRGQSLIETTLILVAFLSLLLAMTGVGEKLFIQQTLTERAHDAARWGAMNGYDVAAIRNLVLYGATAPSNKADSFDGLEPAEVVVTNPGCPGSECRISVALPAHGIRSVEPSEAAALVTGDVASKP